MIRVRREDVPVALAGDGLELRLMEAGSMSIVFYRFSKGVNAARLVKDLPDDLCPCPHWGYFVKGKSLVRTKTEEQVIEAGEAYYIPPGHMQEVLEDAEFIHFSPVAESKRVIDHMRQRIEGQDG